MEYLRGFTVKPERVTAIGEVRFTDGTNNDLMTNQATCEAYGYTYDSASGTCISFKLNSNLSSDMSEILNKNNGSGNTNELGANTIQVNGFNNTTKGFNNSCFINGSNNEIANGVDNATVLGGKGKATTKSALVLGGNVGKTTKNIIQNSTVMCKAKTIDGTTTDSPVNGEAGVNFEIAENTIVAFQSETVAIRYGGTGAGTEGDFKAFIETGAARNLGGTITVDKNRSTIANVGTTSGWVCNLVAVGDYLVQQVKGSNNRSIMWATTIRFTEIKTQEDLT